MPAFRRYIFDFTMDIDLDNNEGKTLYQLIGYDDFPYRVRLFSHKYLMDYEFVSSALTDNQFTDSLNFHDVLNVPVGKLYDEFGLSKAAVHELADRAVSIYEDIVTDHHLMSARLNGSYHAACQECKKSGFNPDEYVSKNDYRTLYYDAESDPPSWHFNYCGHCELYQDFDEKGRRYSGLIYNEGRMCLSLRTSVRNRSWTLMLTEDNMPGLEITASPKGFSASLVFTDEKRHGTLYTYDNVNKVLNLDYTDGGSYSLSKSYHIAYFGEMFLPLRLDHHIGESYEYVPYETPIELVHRFEIDEKSRYDDVQTDYEVCFDGQERIIQTDLAENREIIEVVRIKNGSQNTVCFYVPNKGGYLSFDFASGIAYYSAVTEDKTAVTFSFRRIVSRKRKASALEVKEDAEFKDGKTREFALPLIPLDGSSGKGNLN